MQIKEGQDFVKCEYCGTISSAPKAIEYHQHQSTSYNFSGANPVVNFSNGQDLETLVKNADMHLKLKNYADAQSIYEKISKEYPHDYRGWWGLILAKSRELADTDIFIRKDSVSGYISLSAEYIFITGTWNIVQKTAPQKIKNELASKYQPFYDTCYTKYEKALYTYSVPRYQEKIQDKLKAISYKDNDIKEYKQKIESMQRSIREDTLSMAWRTLLGIVSGVISLALVGYALELLFSLVIILGVLIGAVAVPFVVNTFEQRQKIKFFKDSIKDSKKAINKYNSEISECQKEIDEINKEIKKIESDMSGAKANLTKAEKKLAELTRKA
ncbi:MAG: hypothetical protein MR714_06415 [Christensenellaceae bacterium]|nr:hypothetical protein [Christensenellaceae bacterium]MDD6938527.1 hypothetical protein [Christensenellaceae bacterium]MDY2748871.1 hypothetical protein [Eubacteriales bacterium]